MRAHFRPKNVGLQCFSQQREHSKPPHVHQLVFSEGDVSEPSPFGLDQATARDKHMQVGVKVQTRAEGVRYDDYHYPSAILQPYPLLYHRGADAGQVVQKMTIYRSGRIRGREVWSGLGVLRIPLERARQ